MPTFFVSQIASENREEIQGELAQIEQQEVMIVTE